MTDQFKAIKRDITVLKYMLAVQFLLLLAILVILP